MAWSTYIGLSVTPNPARIDQTVTLDGGIVGPGHRVPEGGTVTIVDGDVVVPGCEAVPLTMIEPNPDGMNQFLCTAVFAPGVHSITARFSGSVEKNSDWAPSTSAPVKFQVLRPAIARFEPARVLPGTGDFTLTVLGSDFLSRSTVFINGSQRATSFIGAGELRASVLASDVALKGTLEIKVQDPGPSFGFSDAATFVVGAIGPDFDIDGNPDLVWRDRVNDTAVAWLMTGTSLRNEEPLASRPGTNWKVVAVGDFNRDGDVDLLWRNSSTGENRAWCFHGTAYAGSLPLPAVADLSWEIAAAADFDGDDKPDIVWRNRATGENLIWFMNRHVYTGYSRLPQVADTRWQLVAAADFDADRRPDLLWYNVRTGETIVWYMDGVAYRSYASILTEGDTNWVPVDCADYNRDGISDVVWRNPVTGQNRVTYVTADGAVSATDPLPAVTNPDWDVLHSASDARPAASDFNEDGIADVLWHNPSTGESSVWYLHGAAKFEADGVLPTEPDANWQPVATGDFNKSGLPQIVWRNSATGENRVWLMEGPADAGDTTLRHLATNALPSVADPDWQIVGAGDFNNDGWCDLAWSNRSTGSAIIWFLHETAPLGWATIARPADRDWRIAGVGDFNGDGAADLAWRHRGTGQVVVWLMHGTAYVDWRPVATITEMTWQIAGVADYNGDGKADLLWRNANDGRNLIWYLSNGAYVGWASLPTLGIEWKTGRGQ